MFNFKKIYNGLFYMGVTKEEFLQIRYDVFEDNRRTISAGSMCSIVFWALCLVMSISIEEYIKCRLVYSIALVSSLITFLGAEFLARKYYNITKSMVFIFCVTIMGSGIGIAYFQPEVRTASLIAFSIIVPVLSVKNSFTDVMLEVCTIMAYFLICHGVLNKEIFYWGLSNLMIYSLAGVLIAHVINDERCQRFINAETAKKLAEIQMKYANYDQLTGLKNRRAYEEEIKHITCGNQNEFCVIMLDLNGLKKANDTYGHEAGDELIVATSKCLQESFDFINSIYRIGGDEFCVIYQGTKEEAKKCLAKLDDKTANWKGKFINSFSISHGVATRNDNVDIESIIKLADEKMYESKRNHYQKSV